LGLARVIHIDARDKEDKYGIRRLIEYVCDRSAVRISVDECKTEYVRFIAHYINDCRNVIKKMADTWESKA
jgi:hypothetical protein